MKKKNGGIVELLIPTFFQKKVSHEGTKIFWPKILWGGCSKLEEYLMIRSCQDLGGVSLMINTFSSRSNLNIKSSIED